MNLERAAWLGALGLAACGTTNSGVDVNKATLIQIEAHTEQQEELGDFLVQGRDIVAETEPGTVNWYALGAPDRPQFAIFDTFADGAGRQAHFEGQVAAALEQNAERLVLGGWRRGVLDNVVHYDVVAATPPRAGVATLAGVIAIKAQPGKAAELAALLTRGSEIVDATEPGTLYWLALRREDRPDEFAIVDFFADRAAVDAHFAGQVAGALEAQAGTLVEGGWDAVVAAVQQFEVRAEK